MELVEYTRQNEEIQTPKVIAQEIYDEIVKSVKRLEGIYGPESSHSTIVELRRERAIAFRALQRFEEIELLTEVA